MTVRVVLVRPWTDVHGGTGCCAGEPRDGICLERRTDAARTVGPEGPAHADEVSLVAATYRRLREELPEVDVQLVSAGNTAYLLPATFSAVRRRRGGWAALREAVRATTAGSVLIDGERLGDLTCLGTDRVVAEVRTRLERARA